jgi:hypothetical protein
MRTFYRDLSFLEVCGIGVKASDSHYELEATLNQALGKLPFPTPELTFADVIELSRGKGAAHRKLKAQLATLTR